MTDAVMYHTKHVQASLRLNLYRDASVASSMRSALVLGLSLTLASPSWWAQQCIQMHSALDLDVQLKLVSSNQHDREPGEF